MFFYLSILVLHFSTLFGLQFGATAPAWMPWSINLLLKSSPQCWAIKMWHQFSCTKPNGLKHCPTADPKVKFPSLLSREKFKTLIFRRMASQRSASALFFSQHISTSVLLKCELQPRSSTFEISSTFSSERVRFWRWLACWKRAVIVTFWLSLHFHNPSLYLFMHLHSFWLYSNQIAPHGFALNACIKNKLLQF